ncbi:hypothetical protein AX769_14875 [Frondihabitans sp. PAMC 28766]|uniref:DMT family transporter n=1 Tax=Frondihabitans sp. PAMC 28766 TaxID=1795630 RepID=UPI00078D7132|nr:DMT family transporter [Frondihabitans sp. PAMC 28766]AMM21183.1 hypothetical protein AX769_14875 [Frondihabitans sp. PAMC 28766]
MGILLAFVGAVCLAIGTEVQNRGVHATSSDRTDSLSGRNFGRLLFNPVWLGGAALIGISIVMQLTSLLLANLVVVQPIGVIGLIVTAFLGARRTHTGLSRRRLLGIVLCIVGIASFVITAGFVGRTPTVTTGELIVVLGILVIVAALGLLLHRVNRSALAYSLAGAVMFGFVATLAQQLLHDLVSLNFSVLFVVALLFVGAAGLLGSSWVQNAQAKGTSTLVLAGLTVVDPLTGVLLTGLVFGELTAAPAGAVAWMLVSGAIAVVGVLFVSQD